MDDKIKEDYIPIFINNIGIVTTNGAPLHSQELLINDEEILSRKLMIEEALEKVKHKVMEIDIKLFEDYYFNGENTTQLSEKYNMDRKIVAYRIDKVIKRMKGLLNGKL